MTGEALDKLLAMNIRLSSEKDYNRLLEGILSDTISMTHCDAGTLYLKEGNFLVFRIMHNNTLKTYKGGQGEKVKLPPIPLDGTSVCARALQNDEIINISNVDSTIKQEFFGTILYDALTHYHTGSMLLIPMKSRDGEMIGEIQLLNAMDKDENVIAFTDENINIAKSAAAQSTISIENMRYVNEVRELFQSLVQVLSSAIDERIPFNAAHTRNMVRYGENFIQYLNNKYNNTEKDRVFSANHKDEFLMSIWLHDIGKIVTPLEILNKGSRLNQEDMTEIKYRFQLMQLQAKILLLEGKITEAEMEICVARIDESGKIIESINSKAYVTDEDIEKLSEIEKWSYKDLEGNIKPWLTKAQLKKLFVRRGTLSEEERIIMENHVVKTEKLLSGIRFSKDYKNVSLWASSHHEFLDGSGYPKHLTKENIPYEVRILTILDIFDAMTADDRPYKPGIPVKQTLDTLEVMAAEGKLDPVIVQDFRDSCCWEALNKTITEVL